MKRVLWLLGIFIIGVVIGCGGGGSGASDDGGGGGGGGTTVTLTAIQIEPQEETIHVGQTVPFKAVGVYSDNTVEDLTASVTWSVTGTAATISSEGLAEGVSGGTAVITASYTNSAGTFTDSANLYVRATTLVSLDVYPIDETIPKGFTVQYAAEGCDADGYCFDLTNDVTWESSDTDVATITTEGVATGIAAGTATIRATFDLLTGETTLTVKDVALTSIAVDPATASIARLTTQQFTAWGTFDDASVYDITQDVTWSSSNTAVADISNDVLSKGLAAGIGAGTATITATYGTISGTATLTVKAVTLTSLTITPVNPTTAIGWPVQFTATGTFSDSTTQDMTSLVAWTSSAGNVARISNVYPSQGLATPIHTGTTTIRATHALTGVTATTTLTVGSVTLTSITVTCTPSTISEGEKSYCKAEGNFGGYTRDITNSVNTTWSSSDKTTASVVNVPKKNKGIVTGLKPGAVTITAKDRKGTVYGTATVTVAASP